MQEKALMVYLLVVGVSKWKMATHRLQEGVEWTWTKSDDYYSTSFSGTEVSADVPLEETGFVNLLWSCWYHSAPLANYIGLDFSYMYIYRTDCVSCSFFSVRTVLGRDALAEAKTVGRLQFPLHACVLARLPAFHPVCLLSVCDIKNNCWKEKDFQRLAVRSPPSMIYKK